MQFHIPLDALQRRDSSPSLALSPLTTARTGCDQGCEQNETHRGSICSGDVSTAAKSTARSSMVMAKLDVSDFLAPLEGRIFARLDAVESMVDRRVGELEKRVAGGGGGQDSERGSFQEQLDDLQRQLLDVKAQVDATAGKSKAWSNDLSGLIKAADDKQASMRNDIDEIWRQLKADRNQGQSKFQEVSDALESHMQSLMHKIGQLPSGPLKFAIEEEGDEFDPMLRAERESEFVVRSQSTPNIGASSLSQVPQHQQQQPLPTQPLGSGSLAGARERSPLGSGPLGGASAGARASPAPPTWAGLRQPTAQQQQPQKSTIRAPSPRSGGGAGASPAMASRVLGGISSPPTLGGFSARQGSPTSTARPVAGASGAALPERRASAPHEQVQRMAHPTGQQRFAAPQRSASQQLHQQQQHPGLRSPLIPPRS